MPKYLFLNENNYEILASCLQFPYGTNGESLPLGKKKRHKNEPVKLKLLQLGLSCASLLNSCLFQDN